MELKKYKVARIFGLLVLSAIGSSGSIGCGSKGNSSAITGPFVYWTGTGVIKKVNIDGGTVAAVAYPYSPTGMATDSSYIYFYNSNGLNKVAKNNNGNNAGIINLTTQITPPSRPGNNWMAVDSSSIYWVDSDNGNGAVKKMSTVGGPITILASNLLSPVNIAIDANNVYWTDRTGLVSEVGINGGTVKNLYDGTSFGAAPNGIAVNNGNVYWDEAELSGNVFTGGAIKEISANGGTVTTLASGLTSPTDLTVDSQNVYWLEFTGSTTSSSIASIMKVSINGGPVTTLASGQTDAKGIVVDSTSVYWLDSCSSGNKTGSVQKVAIRGGTATAIASGLDAPNNIGIDN